MTDSILGLTALDPTWAASTAWAQTAASDESGDFSTLMQLMLLQLAMPSGDDESGSFQSLMMPALLSLLEPLMGLELNTSAPSGMPVLEGRLTQDFHPGHNGLDFGVTVGTPIFATMGGRVVHAGWNDDGYGNLVILENGPYQVYFAHLSGIPVQVGQVVNAGALVGLSGNTGNSTGPHLHYEVRLNGRAIDPTRFTLPVAAGSAVGL